MKKILINLTLLTILSVIISGCDPENVIGKDTTKDETATDYLWDDNNVKTITFNQNSITSSSVDVMIAGTTATITAGGYYAISGNLTDGQLIVNAPKAKLKIMRTVRQHGRLTGIAGPTSGPRGQAYRYANSPSSIHAAFA